MQINVTDIFRIETMNSVYEIKVVDSNGEIVSSCKKMGSDSWHRQVKASGSDYLEKLTIGASFYVPGVLTTSVVQDYAHFVLSGEPKRTTIQGFFGGLVEEIKEQASPRVMVAPVPREPLDTCPPECSKKGWSGPSHNGSRMCKSGSIASGGTRAHCSCDYCY